MSKTFNFAGTCVVDNVTVYKFANDAGRAAVLEKLGAKDVNMIKLPFAMGKDEAIDWLTSQGITAGWRRAAKIAQSAKPAKKAAVAKVATPVAKVKRVGDAPRKGQDPDEFMQQWWAKQEALVGDRFYPKKTA